jgi:hypothetical protein
MTQLEEPKGIAFFNIESGDTHYCKLEPTIAAYLNSSDMGINASRGQDFKWRLAPDWVKRVRAFRRDNLQMSMLAARNSGQKPTTVQILYHLYGEDLRAYDEQGDEDSAPFEQQYQEEIADKPKARPVTAPPAAEPADVPEDVDEADLLPADDEEEIDTDAAAEAATSEPVKSKSQQRREAASKPKQK